MIPATGVGHSRVGGGVRLENYSTAWASARCYARLTVATILSDLELLVRSRYPLIFLETAEKGRAETLLAQLAERLRLPFYTWTRTKGLREPFQLATSRDTLAPVAALGEVERLQRSALYNFQGLGADLEDRVIATKLKDAAWAFGRRDGAIVVTGAELEVPTPLREMSATLSLPLPNLSEYRDLVTHVYRDLKKHIHVEVHMTQRELDQLVGHLKGLTLLEAEKVLTKVMVEDNMLSPTDIERVILAKQTIVGRDGLLEYYPAEENVVELAGLEGLKAWLEKRRKILLEPERAAQFGLTFPKGVLLLGVQGCGKSLCAKAVASGWGLPLLKMDPAKMYDKYIGETEKNLERATKTAEKMSPVVLWIDEIEKAFAPASDMDGGASGRVLGSFLAWLQERRGEVFVVATANDITKLPPELVRKGRFDEIFFVDLPDAAARRAILALHLSKRGRDPRVFDLDKLAECTAGFSGAEIEGVIVAGLYTAFSEGTDLSAQTLLSEIASTRPLSQTYAEKLVELRAWARERAVPAQ